MKVSKKMFYLNLKKEALVRIWLLLQSTPFQQSEPKSCEVKITLGCKTFAAHPAQPVNIPNPGLTLWEASTCQGPLDIKHDADCFFNEV